MAKEKISKDSLFDGRLICYQNRSGYRFSLDSVLLAHTCLQWKKANILDLGCGCGILGLILSYRYSENIHSITGIEIQESLADLAKKNVEENGLGHLINIVQGDYRQIENLFPAEHFSHIICNPPFYQVGRGRVSQNEEAYLARHQVSANSDEIVQTMFYSLKNKGVAKLIFPADMCSNIMAKMSSYRLEPKVLQPIYSYPEMNQANLVIIESVKNGGVGIKVNKPLYIYNEKNGEYSKEIQGMFTP